MRYKANYNKLKKGIQNRYLANRYVYQFYTDGQRRDM